MLNTAASVLSYVRTQRSQRQNDSISSNSCSLNHSIAIAARMGASRPLVTLVVGECFIRSSPFINRECSYSVVVRSVRPRYVFQEIGQCRNGCRFHLPSIHLVTTSLFSIPSGGCRNCQSPAMATQAPMALHRIEIAKQCLRPPIIGLLLYIHSLRTSVQIVQPARCAIRLVEVDRRSIQSTAVGCSAKQCPSHFRIPYCALVADTSPLHKPNCIGKIAACKRIVNRTTVLVERGSTFGTTLRAKGTSSLLNDRSDIFTLPNSSPQLFTKSVRCGQRRIERRKQPTLSHTANRLVSVTSEIELFDRFGYKACKTLDKQVEKTTHCFIRSTIWCPNSLPFVPLCRRCSANLGHIAHTHLGI